MHFIEISSKTGEGIKDLENSIINIIKTKNISEY